MEFGETKRDIKKLYILYLGLPPQTRDTFCLETKSIQKIQGL
jgi:hypothetical protein